MALRIWISRPEPGATRSAARLRTLGHDPLIASIFEIAPTDAPLPDGQFSGIVVTSGQAVPALVRSGLNRNLGGSRPIFAVGERTAESLRDAGLSDVVVGGGDAIGLARLVRKSLPAGAALLHVAGLDRKDEPAATLEAAGFVVRVWAVYSARSLATLPRSVAFALSGSDPAGELDAVLHYSRRGARTAIDLTRMAGLEGAFRALNHYCLSEDVALPLVEVGIAAHFVPAQPTEEALLGGLDGSA